MKKLSIREKIMTFIAVISLFITIVGVLYEIIGFHWVNENKLIRDFRTNGTYQEKIKKIPYVSRFLEYLTDIEEKNINKIWNQMISEKRKNLFSNDKYSFECDHRFTHSYKIEYIIPISNDKNKANFWVLFEFKDLIADNEIRKIKSFSETEIEDITTIPDDVINEVYSIINLRYEINKEENDMKKEIHSYMQKMTTKSIVQLDWRFPTLIAKEVNLKLKSFDSSKTFINTGELQGHHIWSNVVMVKESKIWKVEEFHTIAISRWK
jgi:hypothetical protein